MEGTRVKDWLTMHQCIDKYCPVHSSQNFSAATRSNNLNEEEISQQISNSMSLHDIFASNLDVIEPKKGGFQQEFRDGAGESLTLSNEVNGNERACQELDAIAKPRFMCTWLDKHVDIDNYPFYKLAIYYGSCKGVRKDAAVYSSLVTSHIWSTHKYIASSEDETCCHDSTGSTCLPEIKTSRSHGNLTPSIQCILNNITNVDISDLILEYGYLFSQSNIPKTCDEPNTVIRYQNQSELFRKQKSNPDESFETQKLCQNYFHNARKVNKDSFDEALSDRYFDHVKSEILSFETYPMNENHALGNDKTRSGLPQTSTLKSKNNNNELRFTTFLGAADENRCINSHQTSPGYEIGKVCFGRKKLSKHNSSSVGKYEAGYSLIRYYHVLDNEHKTDFNLNLSRPPSPYTMNMNIKKNDSNMSGLSTNDFGFRDEKVNSPYITDCNSHNQTSYSLYDTDSSHHRSTENMSPLVLKSACLPFISPVVHGILQKVTDQTFYSSTERKEDPRISVSASKYSYNHPEIKEPTENHCEFHTTDMPVIIDSTVYSPYDDNHFAYHDRPSRSWGCKTNQKETRLQSEKSREQYQTCTYDEDPLNGTASKLRSPEIHVESPNSDTYYKLNSYQSKEEVRADNSMDLFYADKCSESDFTSFKCSRNSSRSSEISRYREDRYRSTGHLRHGTPRDRSRSPLEATISRSRRYKNHRHRRSKSIPIKKTCHRDPAPSQHQSSERKVHWPYRHRSISKSYRHGKEYTADFERDKTHHNSYKHLKREKRHDRHSHHYDKRLSPSAELRSLNGKRNRISTSPTFVRSSMSATQSSVKSRRHYNSRRTEVSHNRKDDISRRKGNGYTRRR